MYSETLNINPVFLLAKIQTVDDLIFYICDFFQCKCNKIT